MAQKRKAVVEPAEQPVNGAESEGQPTPVANGQYVREGKSLKGSAAFTCVGCEEEFKVKEIADLEAGLCKACLFAARLEEAHLQGKHDDLEPGMLQDCALCAALPTNLRSQSETDGDGAPADVTSDAPGVENGSEGGETPESPAAPPEPPQEPLGADVLGQAAGLVGILSTVEPALLARAYREAGETDTVKELVSALGVALRAKAPKPVKERKASTGPVNVVRYDTFLIIKRKAAKTGTECGVYDSFHPDSDIEPFEKLRYALQCEHGVVKRCTSKGQAYLEQRDPGVFCSDCKTAGLAPKPEPKVKTVAVAKTEAEELTEPAEVSEDAVGADITEPVEGEEVTEEAAA